MTSDFSPSEFRGLVRSGEWKSATSGICPGYAQVNLVILPGKYAEEFEEFCRLNSCPLPLRGRTEIGDWKIPGSLCAEGDIRSDFPKYVVYKHGKRVGEVTDLTNLYEEHNSQLQFTGFLLGCSFTFERALLASGIPIRNISEGKCVSMFITNIRCQQTKNFDNFMVVSMRPIPKHLVEKTVEITSKFTKSHGKPIHIGEPSAIGIADVSKPDFGDSVAIGNDEVPVFWGCGVTGLQAVRGLQEAEIAVVHAPAHMLVTDVYEGENGDSSM